VLVQLLKDRLRLLFSRFREHHVHLNQGRGLYHMDLEDSVLSILVSPPIHLAEHLEGAALGAADLGVNVDHDPLDPKQGRETASNYSAPIV